MNESFLSVLEKADSELEIEANGFAENEPSETLVISDLGCVTDPHLVTNVETLVEIVETVPVDTVVEADQHLVTNVETLVETVPVDTVVTSAETLVEADQHLVTNVETLVEIVGTVPVDTVVTSAETLVETVPVDTVVEADPHLVTNVETLVETVSTETVDMLTPAFEDLIVTEPLFITETDNSYVRPKPLSEIGVTKSDSTQNVSTLKPKKDRNDIKRKRKAQKLARRVNRDC